MRRSGLNNFRPPRVLRKESAPSINLVPYHSKQREIAWFGPGTDAGGYAGMNREFTFGLSDEFNTHWHLQHTIHDLPSEDLKKIKRMSEYKLTRPNKEVPKVFGMTPVENMHLYPGHKIAYTMMETRMIHPVFVNRVNEADEVWVPSTWNKENFMESGVTKPIKIMPLGIDTNLYRPDSPCLTEWKEQLNSFVVLMVFGWSLRKGIDLIRAYFEAFTWDDDVSLLVCTRYMGRTEDEAKRYVINFFENDIYSQLKNPKPPHCALFLGVADPEDMPKIYSLADVNWSMTRGEGWDRPAMEAGASGKIVIRPDYGAYKDFLNDDTAVLIPVDGFSRLQGLEWITDYYREQEFPILGQSVFDYTVDVLRDVYKRQDMYKLRAERLRRNIVNKYHLPIVVNNVRNRLRTLTGHQVDTINSAVNAM